MNLLAKGRAVTAARDQAGKFRPGTPLPKFASVGRPVTLAPRKSPAASRITEAGAVSEALPGCDVARQVELALGLAPIEQKSKRRRGPAIVKGRQLDGVTVVRNDLADADLEVQAARERSRARTESGLSMARWAIWWPVARRWLTRALASARIWM